MLFDTPSTVQLLNAFNANFNYTGWPAIKANKSLVARLKKVGNFNTYNDICVPLKIVLPGPKLLLWQKWLALFDQDCASLVYPAIAAIIPNSDYLAIEFFAVPNSGTSLSCNSYSVIDNQQGGVTQYTLCIVVMTNTVDQLLAVRQRASRKTSRKP